MTEILTLENVAISSSGATLSLSVEAGQSLAVVGPAASGKTQFLQVIAGVERAPQGAVRVHGTIAAASSDGFAKRTKVQGLIPRSDITPKGIRVADLLYAMRLGEARYQLISELSPGQFAACELLRPLMSDADLIVIDGQLDMLDPWSLGHVVKVMRRLQASGSTFLVATNRMDLIGQFDAVIVLRDRTVRFAGTLEDLRRLGPPHTVQISTQRQETVRALLAPFQVTVDKAEGGYTFSTSEGQELAAKLLLEGYGDVQFVVSRPSTIEEALLSLL